MSVDVGGCQEMLTGIVMNERRSFGFRGWVKERYRWATDTLVCLDLC